MVNHKTTEEESLTKPEEALRESEDRFRAICEHGGIGIALGDLQGRVTFVNLALEKMLGYEKGELVGRNFRDFTFDKDLPEEEAHIKDLLAGNRDHYKIEKRYIRKDGQLIWVALSGSLLRNSDGEPAFSLAMIQDITERKQAEERLAESEAKYRELVQNANSAIIRWKSDGAITFFNEYAQRFFGYSADEIIGKHASILLPQTESTGADLSGLVRDVVANPSDTSTTSMKISAVTAAMFG
jgi:PAS domain S-box-containing protein